MSANSICRRPRRSNYADLIRVYIVPHIGGVQLYSLDKNVIHGLYKTLLARGNKSGGPLSRTTVRTVHRVFMKALKDLGLNISGVRKPLAEQREGMGRKGVWTNRDSKKFLKHHANSHRLIAAWVLAVVVGMRRGELAGLKWSRVDLEFGVLRIHWQRTTTSKSVVEKAPKGKSKRTVAIGPGVVAALRAHLQRQREEKQAAGVLYRDGDYVFCKENGEPYYPNFFTHQWEKACKDAGVPVIVLHDARHTSATSGADNGVPEHVMQQRLGHADGETTRYYTHVLPEAERKAAEVLELVLGDDFTGRPAA